MTQEEVNRETGEILERAEAQASLNMALARAQAEFASIPRDRTVTVKTKTGGEYKFAYAPLDTILAVVRPHLAKNGLAITQQLTSDREGHPMLETMLLHADGGSLSGRFPLRTDGMSPQELGSLITYVRRYALVALLGIASEEDDDGNHATGNAAKAAAAPTVTGPQRKRLWAVAKENTVSEELLRKIVFEIAGVESTMEIPRDKYDLIIEAVQAQAVPF